MILKVDLFLFVCGNIKSFIKKELTVLDFWAPWCGPCRQIAPLIEQLGVQYAGRVKIGKVNIDDNPQAAQHYGIQSIPTLLLFKGGEVVDRFVGMPARTKLEERLESSIS